MTAPTPDAFICDECGELIAVDAAEESGPLYECGDCGSTYTRDDSADGASNRCPDCNKFGAKVTDHACPECSAGELVPLFREVAS